MGTLLDDMTCHSSSKVTHMSPKVEEVRSQTKDAARVTFTTLTDADLEKNRRTVYAYAL